jgi:hypothetical protein
MRSTLDSLCWRVLKDFRTGVYRRAAKSRHVAGRIQAGAHLIDYPAVINSRSDLGA